MSTTTLDTMDRRGFFRLGVLAGGGFMLGSWNGHAAESGATAAFSVGGAGQFTASDLDSLLQPSDRDFLLGRRGVLAAMRGLVQSQLLLALDQLLLQTRRSRPALCLLAAARFDLVASGLYSLGRLLCFLAETLVLLAEMLDLRRESSRLPVCDR